MKISTAAGLATVAALLAGASASEYEDFVTDSGPPVGASLEAIREFSAHGAGVEALRVKGPAIPPQKEGDTLEVIHKGRVPKQARVFIGTFGGLECLAWVGTAERLVPRTDGLPPVPQFVKVVFVKVLRPTKAQRIALRSPAVSGVVEGNA